MSKKKHAEHTWVYAFANGDGSNKQLLGGKGANLCEMTRIGLNVPPGFVITTEACLAYLDHADRELPEGAMEQVTAEMKALEKATGRGFGDAKAPLLVSVRSGSAMSMPGMMDTILNLGLNDKTLKGLIKETGDKRFGYDAYRRFIQLFGKIALGVSDERFDQAFESVKKRVGAKADVDLGAEELKEIAATFLEIVHAETGSPFPQEPMQQLEIAIKAVFNSWMGKRAIDYRRQFNITPAMANGTAVNVVTMVFGNRGDDCATGVGFTRYPDTGENKLFGEYLTNAQGEDVVAGIRTPKPIDVLAQEMPEMYRQLLDLRNKLEAHYKEVQDFEFTIERGVLYCLQTRNGKMNATARVRTAVDMVHEGLIERQEALLRVEPGALEQMLFPQLDPSARAVPLARGLPASPGAGVGQAVFDADRAEQLGRAGKRVILVREETKPEDIHGFFASTGILTSRGGKTSHAAVVARGMGKPCVAGAEGITVNTAQRQAQVGDRLIREGDLITIDGTSGNVFLGEIPMVEPEFTIELSTLLGWADEVSRLGVMANADTPPDAERAVKMGAQGIGLCRTERMFNAVDRLPIVLEMIVAETQEDRQLALDKLLPIQRDDFAGLFRAMAPHPVTIRLLDPPIHEFLPEQEQLEEEIDQLGQLLNTVNGIHVLEDAIQSLGIGAPVPASEALAATAVDPQLVRDAIERKQVILKKVLALREVNPMLGHRGVRLGITFPEIYRMQIQAVLEAAVQCRQEGLEVHPEVMIPQVSTPQELCQVKTIADQAKQAVREKLELENDELLNYRFGSMLEVVRACMRAEGMAEVSEFFSFGTNDLTQATFSFSREDAENKFLPMYNEVGILRDNPFEVLDVEGVGRLMKLAVEWARSARPGMRFGICGEHGGHPASIAFCDRIGLDYVSCSGPRVPIARLAAAHSVLSGGAT
ncbi:MAG: pyruvate, phosphate dikinase, partial [Gammaproteobacteria bacterium]